MNMKCCGQEVRGLLAWDDAQQTDHAYNLYACEKCGVIYKDDVWEDKGLRAIFLDGTMKEASPDEVWKESGLTAGMDDRLKHITLMSLKMAEVKYMDGSKRGYNLITMVAWVLRKIDAQPEKDAMLELFDIDELERRNRAMYASGKIDDLSMSIGYLNAEVEVSAEVRDKYVSDLLEKSGKAEAKLEFHPSKYLKDVDGVWMLASIVGKDLYYAELAKNDNRMDGKFIEHLMEACAVPFYLSHDGSRLFAAPLQIHEEDHGPLRRIAAREALEMTTVATLEHVIEKGSILLGIGDKCPYCGGPPDCNKGPCMEGLHKNHPLRNQDR